jgi:hypothetical protein
MAIEEEGSDQMSYDAKCYELAEAFLADEPTLQTENKKRALAQTIQTTIEEWISWEHRDTPPRRSGEPRFYNE